MRGKFKLDPRCKKCGGKVLFDPAYNADREVSGSCVLCGKNWDLEMTSTGPAGVVARFIHAKMTSASNGN